MRECFDRILICHVYLSLLRISQFDMGRRATTAAALDSFIAADYGKSTFRFLAPSITSIEGRSTGGGAGLGLLTVGLCRTRTDTSSPWSCVASS